MYLSLGANIGDRLGNLRAAIIALHPEAIKVSRVSPVYQTAPVDYVEQPEFLNLIVEGRSILAPEELLVAVQGIEGWLGRERAIANGPRQIDIDILFYGDRILESIELKIPHPRLQNRRFVLQPLSDLAPDLRHPVTQRTIQELLELAPNQLLLRTSLGLDLPWISA